MNNAEYHADPSYGQSALKLIIDSPELFCGRHITKQWPYPESASMSLGSLGHGLLLGGERIIEIPESALTSNGQRRGKAWEAFSEANAGALLVKPEEYAVARKLADNVLAHPTAAKILAAPGPTEESLLWTDEETGLRLKARPDKQATFGEETIVADLKCVRDPTERNFSRAIADYGYAFQAAFYLDAVKLCKGIAPEAFVFIAVRNEPPYETRCWELAESAIELGRSMYRKALKELSRRLKSNDWNGTDWDECRSIDLPKWSYSSEWNDEVAV